MSDGSATIDVILEVQIVDDETDEPPEFSRERYSFAINENDEDGTQLGELGVTDNGEHHLSVVN